MKKFLAAYFVVVLFTSCGCGATEATRRVNVENGLAADFITSHSADPQIKEAAILINAGSHVLEAELGSPEQRPLTYDPKQHGADIETAKKEIESKAGLIDTVWNFAQTTAGKISALVGLGGLGFTIIGWLRSSSNASKLWHYAQVAGEIFKKKDDLKAEFDAKAEEKGVTKKVEKLVADLHAPGETPKTT